MDTRVLGRGFADLAEEAIIYETPALLSFEKALAYTAETSLGPPETHADLSALPAGPLDLGPIPLPPGHAVRNAK
ncbi:MAG: hypothetical protein AAGD22_11400 [Verrucomicrobiota bacterium]